MKAIISLVLVTFIFFAFSPLGFGAEQKSHICFRLIDVDNDGIVTFQEFQRVFGEDRAKYEQIDQDGNDKLTHDEYHHSLGHGVLRDP